MRAVGHEVIAPDMPRVPRPKPDARSVVQPQPGPLGVLLGHFRPFPAPDALDPLVVHPPPAPLQKGDDPPVAVPAMLRRQADDALGHPFFRFRGLLKIASARVWLTECPASTAFRNGEHLMGVLHRPSSQCRASQPALVAVQCFPRPAPARWRYPRAGPPQASLTGSSPALGGFQHCAWSVRRPPYSFRHR